MAAEQQEPLDPIAAFREATAAFTGQTGETRREPPPTISEREVEIARAIGEALIPPDVRARTGGAEVDPGALLADHARGWPPEYRLALRASLRFIEYAPILFQIKPRSATLALATFTSLDHEERERVLKRLDEAHSYHARMLFKLAKALVYMLYYSQLRVSRSLGYDPRKNKAGAEEWVRSRAAPKGAES